MQSDKHYTTCNYGSLPRWYIIPQIFQLVSVAEHATLSPLSHTQKTGLLMAGGPLAEKQQKSLNLAHPQSTSRMATYLGWIQGFVKLIDICLMIIESYPAKTFYLKYHLLIASAE